MDVRELQPGEFHLAALALSELRPERADAHRFYFCRRLRIASYHSPE